MEILNNKVPRLLISAFLFGTVLFLWGNAFYYIQEIYSRYPSVSIRLEQEQLTKSFLKQVIERERGESSQELLAVTAWNMSDNQTILNTELNRESKVSLITVFGDMNTVYPIELMEGSIPSPDDYVGCLIDEQTAYAMFGTVHTVGCLLTYQDDTYCIRGIIKSDIPICLIQEEDENCAYSNLELTYADVQSGDQTAGTFLLRGGVKEAGILLEGGFYAKLLQSAALLPAWFLVLCLLLGMLPGLWRRRTVPVQALVSILILLAVWGLLRWVLELKLFIPQRLIPTSWSDLDFWGRKVYEWKNYLISIKYLSPYPKDVMLFRLLRASLTSLLAVIFGLVLMLAHRRFLIDGFRPEGLVLLYTMTEVIILIILRLCGHLTGLPRAWLLLPLLLPGLVWGRMLRDKLRYD